MNVPEFEPAIWCHGFDIPGVAPCGKVPLTMPEYEKQMRDAFKGWRCPQCGASADWDGNDE